MNLFIHNLKVAVRNLMKYKLQTAISVLSIAIGIVTLALAHSLIDGYRLPYIYHTQHFDRAYDVTFQSVSDEKPGSMNIEIIRNLKKKIGAGSAEKIVVENSVSIGIPTEFHLSDSTVRKGYVPIQMIDSGYAEYAGLKSAITGKDIARLHPGEGIVSEDFAEKNFQGRNPIGAIQTFTLAAQAGIPIKIVDVFKSVSLSDAPINNDGFFYCGDEKAETENYNLDFIPIYMSIVLKEGFTGQQLLKELDDFLLPYGMSANISKVSDKRELRKIIAIRMLTYIIGSLILLAAMIGFLRIQTQLLRLRRRELALRIVNGAKTRELFGLLFAEIAITVFISVIIAMLLGTLLQDFIGSKLMLFMEYSDYKVKNLCWYSLVIGAILTAICSLTAWILLLQICRSGRSLDKNMRRSNRHLWRNVMLGLQTTIVIVLVCGVLILLNGEKYIIRACNMPENDSEIKEYLYFAPKDYFHKWEGLHDEIRRLPELDRMIQYDLFLLPIQEYEEAVNPDGGMVTRNFKTIFTDDKTLPDVLGMDADWFNRDIDRNQCVLVSEKIYHEFEELGLLDNNSLNIGYSTNPIFLPIGGILRTVPYEMNGETIIVIRPVEARAGTEFLLVPKPGKGNALARSVNEAIATHAPECFNNMIYSYRERTNPMPDLVETVRAGGWILSVVSLIICAMGIFSCITLDTRARRKEIAIRKINGAKSKDIYSLFGRVYALILLISVTIAVPVCIIINRWVENYVNENIPIGTHLSPVRPIAIGCSVIVLLVLAIVGWQIYRTMQTDAAKIIAKE